jgi:katanin p60 ATPase-containing subunit A1
MSKEEKLALRKNVNNHYNQFIGDIGNPIIGNMNINYEQNVNNNFQNNLRGGDNKPETDKDPMEWSPAPKKKE